MVLTEKQQRLVELNRKKDNEIKKFYEEYEEALVAVIAEGGIGSHFQDDEGIVYQLVIPEGRFVKFDKFALNHTRRSTEEKGTLSEKAAKEMGFEVLKR